MGMRHLGGEILFTQMCDVGRTKSGDGAGVHDPKMAREEGIGSRE